MHRRFIKSLVTVTLIPFLPKTKLNQSTFSNSSEFSTQKLVSNRFHAKSSRMSRAVLKCLSLVLGAFFVFVGVLKLTPAVSPDMHKELKRNFASQAKVFPLTSVLNFKISPKLYREVVGYAEVVCGLLLLFAPDAAGQLATALLFSIVTLAIYSHWKLQDRFDRVAPGVVMALLLVQACRFIVFVQMRRKRQKPQQLPDKYSTESSTATTAVSSSSSAKKSD